MNGKFLLKRVIVDFDNTMGIQGCDVDDGLALLYLLGNPDRVQVVAACTTYGNNTLANVQENTEHLFEEWGLDVPIYRGASTPDNNAAKACDASRFLARMTEENQGEISVLATGSLTNLKGALLLNHRFAENAAEIVLMGGIERSLVINGKIMNELNFSCDAEATFQNLDSVKHGMAISIATAQNCLPAFFEKDDFVREFGADSWMTKTIDYWFSDMEQAYSWNGFTCWDVVAAAMLAKPELFDRTTRNVTLNRKFFSIGLLEESEGDAPSVRVNTPRILDPDALRADVISSWKNALDILGIR